jgi:hypothetical protein
MPICVRPVVIAPQFPFTPGIGATPKLIPDLVRFDHAQGPAIVIASFPCPMNSSVWLFGALFPKGNLRQKRLDGISETTNLFWSKIRWHNLVRTTKLQHGTAGLAKSPAVVISGYQK